MTTRTRYGLTLTYNDGEWVAADGVTTISRVQAIETCWNPHPMRYRDENGRMVRTYCEGDSGHYRWVGWDIRPPLPTDDLYGTLDEAWQVLAKAMTR